MTLEELTVTPASTEAGSHPSVTILTAHSGKVRQFRQELATRRVKPTKRNRTCTMAALLRSPRRWPDLRRAKVVLPKRLRRGRTRPRG